MTDTPMTPDVALTRLRQYGERTTGWSTATYNNGTERALHQIAVSLAAEVDRMRARVAEPETLKPARFQDCQVCGAGHEYGQPCSACEFNKQMAAATPARRMLRPDACDSCGATPDEWCPDCAACRQGCHGGHDNNPCTHPNAPWNTEATP